MARGVEGKVDSPRGFAKRFKKGISLLIGDGKQGGELRHLACGKLAPKVEVEAGGSVKVGNPGMDGLHEPIAVRYGLVGLKKHRMPEFVETTMQALYSREPLTHLNGHIVELDNVFHIVLNNARDAYRAVSVRNGKIFKLDTVRLYP